MKDIFTGKVVWITGASSGIGEALVKAFASGGSRVIASSNDSARLAKVAGECSSMPGSVTAVPFDLGDTSGIEELAADVVRREGRIDMLLNIGGISQRALLKDTPLWLDRKIMEINYFGTIALTKAVLPHMLVWVLQPPLPLQQRCKAQQQEGGRWPGGGMGAGQEVPQQGGEQVPEVEV